MKQPQVHDESNPENGRQNSTGPIFELPDELLGELRTRQSEPGVPIYSYSETIDTFHLLRDGLIGLYRFIQPNKRILLRKVLPGESVGVTQMLLDDPYPGHLIPIKESTMLNGDSNDLKTLKTQETDTLNRILMKESQAHGRTYDKIASLLAGNVNERIAGELLELTEAVGTPAETGSTIDVPLTRKDVARMVGCTPESASRVMSKWEKEGVINTNRKKITVLKPLILRELVDSIA